MSSEMKAISPGGRANRWSFRTGFGLGLGVLVLVLSGALGFVAKEATNAATEIPKASVAIAPMEGLSNAFEKVAKLVEPAVVNISTEQIIHTSSMMQNPFGEMFGGNNPFGFPFDLPRDLKQKSLGSGFIVDPQGYILTNNHVVKDASKIKVKLQDGRELNGTVVGTDPQTDLAVVKIDAGNLPVLRLANSEDVRVGEWVLAFGSPFGLEQTMTAGIISAKGRVVGAGNYDNFLQTDAAINPGNSGGPLVNLQGEVVGINTMILSDSGGSQGVGLAIPSSMAENVYHQLARSGKVTRGWLGVGIQELTPALAKSFNMKDSKGVLIRQVESGSPAAKAGLRSGDIILEYNGKTTSDPRELSIAVAETKVGVPAKLRILRDGKELTLEAPVGERPAEAAEAARPSQKTERDKLGVSVENIDSESAHQLNLSSTRGALVTDVQSGSPADDGGVQPGDVIREVNHKSVNNVSELQSTVRDLKAGSTVLLNVVRQGQTLFLAFDLS